MNLLLYNDLFSNFLESGIKAMEMKNNKYNIQFDIISKQKLGLVLISILCTLIEVH